MVFLGNVIRHHRVRRRPRHDHVVAALVRQAAVGAVDVATAVVDKDHFVRRAIAIKIGLLLRRLHSPGTQILIEHHWNSPRNRTALARHVLGLEVMMTQLLLIELLQINAASRLALDDSSRRLSVIHDRIRAIETLRRHDMFVIQPFVQIAAVVVLELNVTLGWQFA